ncbi:hypothetical protein Ctha_1499 [Chloroherpeton thalassium ATCC 35110]|uniref:Glycosyltransferase RgtA/B/C/D-like domain-containing protein n=1 Tax=Chloroherpeton thalassium (strain ATCC 35110 / GB-78) TaxID=517418 RepID=B3QS13_CHLT3|nr:hypothetical protein [Chloroherpeton thalassium]ACF13958.1 hypothetical protein Ctha_1499 [Chloroherpeton thalassium ATCC 35110]
MSRIFNIMPVRQLYAEQAIAGYEKTGVPLVSWDGSSFVPTANSDDKGMYFIFQKLSAWFGFSADEAITVFHLFFVIVAFLLALGGTMLYFQARASKFLAALVIVLLSAITLYRGDSYMMNSVFALSTVPLFLYFVEKKKPLWLFGFFIFVGAFAALAGFVRAHAATGTLIFLGVVLFFHYSATLKTKLLLLVGLFVGLISVNHYIASLFDARDAFLLKINPAYQEYMTTGHVFWHSIYIGLGYVSNPEIKAYQDEEGINKVRSLAPEVRYTSPKYEELLKYETLSFIRNYPGYFAANIFAKLGVIFVYLMVFANAGLLAAYFYRKPLVLDIAFAMAMGFNMLFGVLVVPRLNYLLGFACFAAMFGMYSINFALEKKSVQEVLGQFGLHQKAK